MADSEQKYSLSFTSIGARRSETVEVARAYVDCLDWTEVRRRIVEDNIISLNKESTRKRVGSELVKRLRMLDTDEMAFLADAVDDDQLAMIWVVICRTYPVLRASPRWCPTCRERRGRHSSTRSRWTTPSLHALPTSRASSSRSGLLGCSANAASSTTPTT